MYFVDLSLLRSFKVCTSLLLYFHIEFVIFSILNMHLYKSMQSIQSYVEPEHYIKLENIIFSSRVIAIVVQKYITQVLRT